MDIYENQNRVEDRALLEKDKLSYAVLFYVLGGKVKKVITDHKRILIAHTAPVFPTWIWAPDNMTEEELDVIYRTVKKEFTPIENYRFNTKCEIADYLIKRLEKEGVKFHISVNIAAYDCPTPRAPKKQVDGYLDMPTLDELVLSAKMIREAALEIGDRILAEEESLQAAKEQIENQNLFFWRDADGKVVSVCGKTEDENYVKLTHAYTLPECRRKNYAGRMIYEICLKIVENGQVPMLYADADYFASNRCYQNIGFELKGKLVTIGA